MNGASDSLEGRAVWTDADFDRMGWHDASVHAIAFVPNEDGPAGDLLLDIDYIVEWIHPEATGDPFRFVVAPATLVFDDVWGIKGDLELQISLPEIDAIRKEDNHHWCIDGHNFTLDFTAAGFSQHFRSPGIEAGTCQFLRASQRGGQSFDRPEAF